MKTLTILLLILSFVGYGQNKLNIISYKDGDPVGNSKPQNRLKVNYIPGDRSGKLVNSIISDMKPEIKCSKCGNIVMMYKGLTTNSKQLIYYCDKCGTTNKFDVDKDPQLMFSNQHPIYTPLDICITTNPPTYENYNRFDKEFKKADSVWGNKTIAISGFSPNEMLTLSRQKITICLDYFKVTDTIWIQAGKRKVGIPAYKFLEYFKEDYPTLTSPTWQGGSLFNHVTPTDGKH